MEQTSFRELLDETRTRTNGIQSHGHKLAVLLIDGVKDVPEAVKLKILSSIRSFVDKEIE